MINNSGRLWVLVSEEELKQREGSHFIHNCSFCGAKFIAATEEDLLKNEIVTGLINLNYKESARIQNKLWIQKIRKLRQKTKTFGKMSEPFECVQDRLLHVLDREFEKLIEEDS